MYLKFQVLEYCEHHKKDPLPETVSEPETRKKSEEFDEWDLDYIKVEQELLFEIILVSRNTILSLYPT